MDVRRLAGRGRRRSLLALAAALAAAGAAAGGIALARDDSRPEITGTLVDRPVPDLPLLDERGRRITLAAFRGKVVVLAPFLTLCHEVCPLTTGAFAQMRDAVRRAGLGDRVVFVETSVDPWRDTPARLRAFARLTGIRFRLLTGTNAELSRFWRFFGVAFLRTREDAPPDTDWWTDRPLTFDVSHTDGLFLLDANGHERIVDVGMPNVDGRLARVLRGLLNDTGRANLAHPEQAWTVRDGLDDVGYLLGRRIPLGEGR